MIALEVLLNGKRICIAGAEDLSVLMAQVTAVGKLGKKTVRKRMVEDAETDFDLMYTVSGLTGRKDREKDVHLDWKPAELMQIGDVLQVKIIETDRVDRPKSRKRAYKKPV